MKAANKNKLKPFESNLRTAYYNDYSRNLPTSALNTIEQVVFDEIPGWNKRTNMSCSHCVLRLLKAAGKLYFEKKSE